MFNFFRKKPDPNNIKNFQDILNLIGFYIDEKKWANAHKTLNETIEIERKNAIKEIEKLEKDDLEYKDKKQKIENILNKNTLELQKLEKKLEIDEEKYRFIPDRIKKYKDAIKSIKTLTILKEWNEVEKAVKEITKVEKDAFDKLLIRLEKEFKDRGEELLFETEKKKQLKIYNKKELELKTLLQKSKNLEKEYNNKIEEAKFKIRFKRIKSEVELLTKTGKNPEALNILKSFLEENKQNSSVIKFYNKEKEKILKNIEKIKQIENKKIEKNIKLEASKLIGQTIKIGKEEEIEEESDKKDGFFKQIKNKINFYHKLKEKIRKKQLVDEVTLLIEENKNLNAEIASKKLENIHKGLVKEISPQNVNGYDLYGKILGADKISGDTFGLVETDKKYNLFLGDATGHGIKAGLIVTLLTRLFNNNAKKKSLKELAFVINNGLKQDLESRNFITGILFQINKDKTDTIEYVGMGHEPMLVYRAKNKVVEKFIPGGLAAGIRMIKKIDNIKTKNINLEDGDILLTYSDGVLESKGIKGEYYGLDRLKETFLKISQIENNSEKIYRHLIDHLVAFRGGTAFDDDTTILIVKRDENSDIQKKDSEFIKTLASKENLDTKEYKKLVGKNKKEIFEELETIKKEKQVKSIVRNLKKLYHVGEFLKLKQEAIRYIKEGWVHKDINMYLKKAMSNEVKYKIKLKNKKIENRYNIIEQLYKKGDYDTVIRELEDIISKDGEI